MAIDPTIPALEAELRRRADVIESLGSLADSLTTVLADHVCDDEMCRCHTTLAAAEVALGIDGQGASDA